MHAAPFAVGDIDPVRSMTEVYRVVRDEAALMAFIGNGLVGTLGLVAADYWYSQSRFLSNRWLFVAPHHARSGAGGAMIVEAELIAQQAGLPLVIIAEDKGKVLVLNDPRRKDRRTGMPAANGSGHRQVPNGSIPLMETEQDVLRRH